MIEYVSFLITDDVCGTRNIWNDINNINIQCGMCVKRIDVMSE